MTRLHQLGAFLKNIITTPRTMGTVWPSSKQLAKEMASHVSMDGKGGVVELGAGTGPITEALLMHGVDPKRIIAVEYLPNFVDKLRQRFPQIQVIKGDAVNLNYFLDNLIPK